MSPDSSTKTGGRGQRTKKKSERARDSDGPVPGIDSTIHSVPYNDSSFLSQGSNTSTPKNTKVMRDDSANRSASNMSKKKGAKYAPGSTVSGTYTPAVPGQATLASSGGIADATAQGGKDVSSIRDHNQMTTQPQPQTKKSARVRKSQRKAGGTPRGRPRNPVQQQRIPIEAAGIFSASVLQIYPWEVPRPRDFLNLPELRKAWKVAQDAREQGADNDPELDDWYDFAGNAGDYSSCDIAPGASIEFSIARSFIKRAKRAFWGGESWVDFEFEERSIVPSKNAVAVEDPVRRNLLLAEVVDNNLRLHIFDQIQIRLCHEIWLGQHPNIDDMVMHDGKIVKKDSVVEAMEVAPLAGMPPPAVVAPVLVQPAEVNQSFDQQIQQVDTSEGSQYVPSRMREHNEDGVGIPRSNSFAHPSA